MTRLLAVVALLVLAACSGSPESLGITGPGAPPPPPPTPDDSTLTAPGITNPTGGGYGPSLGPTTSGGRYFNYN